MYLFGCSERMPRRTRLLLPTTMPRSPHTLVMESPFAEYLGTNYVPTGTEIERIRAYLGPHEAELARLSSLVRELKDHIQSHRTLVSHSRRLPQDILEQVFLACLPTLHNAVMSPLEPPLLLGRICSEWRSIAFSMPRLWASLHIPEPFISGNKQRKAAMVDWLVRSGKCPLTLSASYGRKPLENLALTNFLLGFSERLRGLHLSNLDITDFSSNWANADAPSLVDITIEFGKNLPHPHTFGAVLASPLIRTNLPKRVTITARYLDVLIPMSVPFAWDHLTDLSLLNSGDNTLGLPVEGLHTLLKGCTRLLSLRVRLACHGSVPGRLLHPTLESFVVVGPISSRDTLSNGVLLLIIHNLEMPSLVRFHAPDAFDDAISICWFNFLRKLAENSPLISDLKLTLTDYREPELAKVLQLFPHLTRLDLLHYRPLPSTRSYESDATTLLSLLTTSHLTGQNLCPGLTELVTQGEWFDIEPLLIFLRRQSDYAPNLRRLDFLVWGAPPGGLPDVTPFIDRGLEVLLRLPPKADDLKSKATAKRGAWMGVDLRI
ncbi:hypothetical protein C8R47DRAFT_516041 [Mycena vitilis]|nr:hypothetical protein C8R47DRAFT_516041 [Mycena vitilis]